MKSSIITILISFSALAQMRPDLTSNPSAGFGTATTTIPTTETPTNLFPSTTLPQEQQETNNFAGGALGGATPGLTLPGTTSPGVAPTFPNLPGTGLGTGATAPTTP